MKKLNLTDLRQAIFEKKGLSLLFVLTKDCDSCFQLQEKIEKDLSAFSDGIGFYYLDIDENPSFMAYFKIPSIPSVLIFENGRLKRAFSNEKFDSVAEFVKEYFEKKKDKANLSIKVFTTPTCPYCHMLKEYLKENGVNYEEIDLSQNQEWTRKMVERSGQMGVPQMWVGEEVVVGFDKGKIDQLLGL